MTSSSDSSVMVQAVAGQPNMWRQPYRRAIRHATVKIKVRGKAVLE
jgi:hypothetical protein